MNRYATACQRRLRSRPRRSANIGKRENYLKNWFRKAGGAESRQEYRSRWRGNQTRSCFWHYNGPHECLSPLAQNLALMKFDPRLARAAWAKSTVPTIAGLVVMLPSRSCRNRWRETLNGCGDLKLRRGRLRR